MSSEDLSPKKEVKVQQYNPEELKILQRAIKKGKGDKEATFKALEEELSEHIESTEKLKKQLKDILDRGR